MDSILNFDGELSIESFDQVVAAMYTSGPCQAEANRVLQEFRQHPEAWKRVDAILERSVFPQSKHIALSILEDLIKSMWNALPQGQRTGIKNFVVAVVIKSSSSDELMEKNKLFLNKLNVVLVQILKRDWPHNWPTFIDEIVNSSKTNLTLCENNMVILKLLSEEIFDYSAEEMVSAKIVTLKNKLKSEFSQIYQLCHEVIEKATKPSLIAATLDTLLRFINWIPHEYIFETNIIEVLASRFIETLIFRIVLKCFTEISGLEIDTKYTRNIIFLYKAAISGISRLIPVTIDISQKWITASDQDQQFIQNVALFLTTVFSTKLKYLEAEILTDPNFEEAIIFGHRYLLNISEVDDRELFKICLEYWSKFTSELTLEAKMSSMSDNFTLHLNGMMRQSESSGLNSAHKSRGDIYKRILGSLRNVMIGAMVKPEEVLVVEVDGVVIREVLKESETIFLYKSMREVLIHLTHLDTADMELIMEKKLEKFMGSGALFNRMDLSKLCWAIGSISGAMSEEAEKCFLVFVIRNLLTLCENKKGKDDKAVVASNIMYVVGQYPRFLRAHWRFLKTVVNKLFEFMHEKHEGVQDMACDTLIKIAQKCKKHFVVQQPQELSPYIETILESVEDITSDLVLSQLQTFYEALGYIISSQTNKSAREMLIEKLMAPSNNIWSYLMLQVKESSSILTTGNDIELFTKILRINISVSNSTKSAYYVQLKVIYFELLALYTVISNILRDEIALKGASVAVLNSFSTKRLRSVRKDIIRLLDSFLTNAEDVELVVEPTIPMILQVTALEYSGSDNSIKESDVLVLVITIVKVYKAYASLIIPGIMDSVFGCTLEMINKNFEDYPDIRATFYNLLEAMITNAFDSVIKFPPERFNLLFNSLLWASKHTLRDISDVGLSAITSLLEQLSSYNGVETINFYKSHYVTLLQEILFIITNPFHKPGFESQCVILMHLINLIDSGTLNIPLYDASLFTNGQMNNRIYVEALISDIIQETFRHVQEPQILQFIRGLFENCKNLQKFTDLIRDFLIASKEIAGAEDLRLYNQAREVASNATPSDLKGSRAKDPLNFMAQGSLVVSEAVAGAEDMTS